MQHPTPGNGYKNNLQGHTKLAGWGQYHVGTNRGPLYPSKCALPGQLDPAQLGV